MSLQFSEIDQCKPMPKGNVINWKVAQNMQHGGQAQNSFPRNTCTARNSSKCGYIKYDSLRQYGNHQSEAPGVYLDLTAPTIAGRPIHNEHDNHTKLPNTLARDAKHNLDKYYDCQQPFWAEKCQ